MNYLFVSFLIFIKELVIKNLVDSAKTLPEKTFLFKTFGITRVRNKGLCFSLLSDRQDLANELAINTGIRFSLMAVAQMMDKRRPKAYKYALAIMLGGTLSNFYDRVFRGYVVDYISIKRGTKLMKQYVFNLSDVYIVAGSFLAAVFSKKPSPKIDENINEAEQF